MWQDIYKKEVAGKTKAVHVDFLNTLLEIIEDENELLRIPNLIYILSCSLIDKLIEILVKFFCGTKLKCKKRIYCYDFFFTINLEVGMGLNKKDS